MTTRAHALYDPKTGVINTIDAGDQEDMVHQVSNIQWVIEVPESTDPDEYLVVEGKLVPVK